MNNQKPKKPTDLRKRLGDPGKGRTASRKPSVMPDMSSVAGITANPPSDLTDEAKALWEVITSTSGWLVESDTPALILLCRLHDKVHAAMDEDHLTPAGAGATKTYMSLLERFGLTPASRINLGLAVAETKTRLDQFRSENAG